MPERTEKRCPTCEQVLPIGDFGADKSRPDGVRARCRKCLTAWNKRRREEDPEYAERVRKNNANMQEYRNAYYKQQRQDNPGCQAKYDKKWYDANPEKVKAKLKNYRENNREKINARQRDYRDRNPDVHKAYDKEKHVKRHTLLMAARKLGRHTSKQWMQICAHYGFKCLRCGREDVEVSRDHILPLELGGSDGPDNLQPLCMSCNTKKKNDRVDYRPDHGAFARTLM